MTMKKLFLLSVCLVGFSFTACQKDTMPEPAPTQKDGITPQAAVYSFSPNEQHLYFLPGPERKHSVKYYLAYNGYIGGYRDMSDFKIVDYCPDCYHPPYAHITPYVEITGTESDGSVTVRFKPGLGDYVGDSKGYLRYRNPYTLETAEAVIWVHAHGQPILE